MDRHQILAIAKEKMNGAEDALRRCATTYPDDMAEYARLSEAARHARKDFTNVLDAMAVSISESTNAIFAGSEQSLAK